MKIRVQLCLAFAALLAGCAHDPAFAPGPGLTLVDTDQLPPPAGAMAGAQTRPFRVGAYDKVSVGVYGLPDLSQTVQVDAAGRMAVPLVGEIDAAGKTPAELAEVIRQGLRAKYIRDPQVTVNIEETASQVITVDGQVIEPGVYPVVGHMTLQRAIASAKGTNEFARLQDVVVFRTVGDQRMAALYNLEAIRLGAYRDPEVYADDVIVVGDSPARRRFRNLLQAGPLLLAPVVALISSGAI